MSGGGDGDLDVLAMPDYRDVNPYQRELEETLADRGVNVTTRSGGGRLLPILRAVRAHGVPDVLHVHFFAQFMVANASGPVRWFRTPVMFVLCTRTLVELVVMRALGVRVVWTAHDLLNHERIGWSIEIAFKHLLVRWLADEVVVHCDRATELLTETFRLPPGAAEKLTVIPHGHFLDEYPDEVGQPAARAELDLPEDVVVFLFFGWVREYKNVPLLIETFDGLDGDAHLVVAGNTRAESVERAVREAAADAERVHLRLEYVPDDEIQYYMNAADVAVLPFKARKQSLLTSGSAILAMGYRNAVITPDIGCVGEMVDGEGGIAYLPGDDERTALHAALTSILDADAAAMGEYNYQRVCGLDWASVAAATRDVYYGVEQGWPLSADVDSQGRPGRAD